VAVAGVTLIVAMWIAREALIVPLLFFGLVLSLFCAACGSVPAIDAFDGGRNDEGISIGPAPLRSLSHAEYLNALFRSVCRLGATTAHETSRSFGWWF